MQTIKKKRILYFMPENPNSSKAGNLTRCKQLLTYFNTISVNFEIDFVSSINWGPRDESIFHSEFPNINLIILPFKSSKKNRISYFFGDKLQKEIKNIFHSNLVDRVSPSFQRRFEKVLSAHRYDYIIISYVEFGSLVKNLIGPYTILDSHDFLTLQNKTKEKEHFSMRQLGKMFGAELSTMASFNEIWTFSIEEKYIFEQFADKFVRLIPVSMPLPVIRECEKTIDLIYVASDNPHNVSSMKWFLEKVFPLLTNVELHVIGKICVHIPTLKNVIKHGLVDELAGYYEQAKVAICPMLSGTGIKIKVLEALSFGIPVVTNQRGVDGLFNKSDNGCLISLDEQAFASNITELLQDDQFHKRKSNQAIEYMRNNHTVKKEYEVLDAVFNNV
ncbi:glycosyltransferase [Sphingobacterium sp. UBA5996]|uniref:glycosyltransferase n=1 Tax=Sphingobacterium sp. UBA5996 TaxID=1947505 RepID=UPI0025FAC7F0|nr:glycosyltransferase [Sphingobacterium sp. UBA5996]